MAFSTYILFSALSSRYYTGHSENLQKRLDEHNNGRTPSIRNGIPWKVIWNHEFATKAEAMATEIKIKKRGAKRFLEDLSRGA